MLLRSSVKRRLIKKVWGYVNSHFSVWGYVRTKRLGTPGIEKSVGANKKKFNISVFFFSLDVFKQDVPKDIFC